MKHLLLFAMLATCCGLANAQDISYLYNNDIYGNDDTIECSLPNGIMLELNGFGISNNSSSMISLRYVVDYVEGANISVGGICTSRGMCMSGNTSAPFTVEANNTYTGIALEMMVPDEVQNGESALFRITAIDSDTPTGTNIDDPPHTWLRVRCSSSGIHSAQAVPLHIYPNPTTDRMVIDASSLPQGSTLCVYNAQGQQVLQQPISESSCTINVRQWATGIYPILIVAEGRITAAAQLVKE